MRQGVVSNVGEASTVGTEYEKKREFLDPGNRRMVGYPLRLD